MIGRSFGVILPCLLTAACARQTETANGRNSPAPFAAVKRTRSAVFDHTQRDHAKIVCEQCHARQLAAATKVEPTLPPHTACSDCHSTENYLDVSKTEPLCATCHPANQILDAAQHTRVVPFPSRLDQFGVAAFSHRDHMDQTKMADHPLGYGCEFCHGGGTVNGPKTFPAHVECYSCHIHQAGQRLGKCRDCHAPNPESLVFSHAGGIAVKDFNFLHSGHVKRKDGSSIPCSECHGLIAAGPKASDVLRIEPARGLHHTSKCWGACHKQKEETRCQKCHVRGVPIPARAS